ncbi:hypothetical protein Leryth_016892, partial [Lithospermum erythrorhizon]
GGEGGGNNNRFRVNDFRLPYIRDIELQKRVIGPGEFSGLAVRVMVQGSRSVLQFTVVSQTGRDRECLLS